MRSVVTDLNIRVRKPKQQTSLLCVVTPKLRFLNHNSRHKAGISEKFKGTVAHTVL